MSQTSRVELEDVTVHESEYVWVDDLEEYQHRCMTCPDQPGWPCVPEQLKRKDKKIRQLETRLSSFKARWEARNVFVNELLQHNEALAEELDKVEKALAELKDRGLTW